MFNIQKHAQTHIKFTNHRHHVTYDFYACCYVIIVEFWKPK